MASKTIISPNNTRRDYVPTHLARFFDRLATMGIDVNDKLI